MLNDSLSQGSLIRLSYAYFFSTSEPEYAYKRYAYIKKKHVANFKMALTRRMEKKETTNFIHKLK